jgi:hypothetical protein
MARLREVILRGTRILQPAATTVDVGVLYCVTDEANIVERSSGAVWQAYGYAGALADDLTADSIALNGDLVVQTVATFHGQYVSPTFNDGNRGSPTTIDWSEGNEHYLTLTGNVVLTFANPVDGGRYVVLINSGVGGFTVTWPGTVKWAPSTPAVSTAASTVDLFTFIFLSATSYYYGAYNQGY